jgi:hypothetical protein
VLLLQFTYLLPAETSQKLAILEVKAQHFLESYLEITHNARIDVRQLLPPTNWQPGAQVQYYSKPYLSTRNYVQNEIIGSAPVTNCIS